MTLIPQLERDLVAAAGRHSFGRRLLPNRSRTTLAVVIAAFVIVGGAAAATGVLSVGSVFHGEGFHSEQGKKTVRETVVAQGTVPIAGDWRMTTFKTDRGNVTCLKVTLLAPAPGPQSSGYCGYFHSFDEFGHGGKAVGRRRGEVLLFGTAPQAARRIELTGKGGKRIVGLAQPGPSGVPGRFWLIAAPPSLRDARLEWLDHNGRAGARRIDVSYRFEGPTGRVLAASGTDRLAGPWRMTVYESPGSVVDGDRYESEGLPGIELSLPHPHAGLPSRGGGTGVIRNAPGFIRGQHTLRDSHNKVLGMVLYGRAPGHADHVRIAAKGGVRLLVDTRKGPAGVPGRFWFIATKLRLRDGHMRWVDTDTGKVGPAVAVLPP